MNNVQNALFILQSQIGEWLRKPTCVLSLDLNVDMVRNDVTSGGRLFHLLAAVTRNADGDKAAKRRPSSPVQVDERPGTQACRKFALVHEANANGWATM